MKRHRLDMVSLFFGFIFVGLAVTGAFGDEDITLLEARWVWPVLLVVAGLAIVAVSLQRNAGNRKPVDPPLEPETADDVDAYDPIN